MPISHADMHGIPAWSDCQGFFDDVSGPLRAVRCKIDHADRETRVDGVGARIRQTRQRKGWSIAKLAREAELDGGYLSRVETGKIVSPGIETIRRIAAALDVGPEELLPTETVEVPVVGVSLAAGRAIYGETLETVQVPARLAKNRRLVASRIVGDCMDPEIKPGDTVTVDVSDRNPRPGDLVAVLMEDGNMMVKRFDRRDNEPILLDNKGGEYRPNGAKIQGVVVYVGRAYR